MRDYNLTTRRVWDSEEEPAMVDEILEGRGKYCPVANHFSV